MATPRSPTPVTNVDKLAAAYKSVITTLGATRLDMDVEDRSLEDTA
jgi:hypothetical protein